MNLLNVDPGTLVGSIRQQIYVKDLEGRYCYVNEFFADSAGLSPQEIIGRTDYELVWKAQAAYFQEDDQRVLQGVSLLNIERYQTRANGLAKIILNLTPYMDGGKIVGVIGNYFDHSLHFTPNRGVFQNNKFYLEHNNEWLSVTELRVIFLHFHGFKPEDIAEKMEITLSTVRYHLGNIKVKMGCTHINELQKVAIDNGVFWNIFTLQHKIKE